MRRSKVFLLLLVLCYAVIQSVENEESLGVFKSLKQDSVVTARKRKKDKLLSAFLLGGLIIKAIILPIAFKAMAVMTAISVFLSFMSLILASITGFTRTAWNIIHPGKYYQGYVEEQPEEEYLPVKNNLLYYY